MVKKSTAYGCWTFHFSKKKMCSYCHNPLGRIDIGTKKKSKKGNNSKNTLHRVTSLDDMRCACYNKQVFQV